MKDNIKIEVSNETFAEILCKMHARGCMDAFKEDESDPKNLIVDMNGVMLIKEKNKP